MEVDPNSAFLQVFIGIFGTEYVIFGAVVLLVRRGLWPEALTDFGPPSSLPVTVAVFGILVWAASHLTVIKSITRIADLYFDTPFVGTARVSGLSARCRCARAALQRSRWCRWF